VLHLLYKDGGIRSLASAGSPVMLVPAMPAMMLTNPSNSRIDSAPLQGLER
jgi:hypothetical protein